MGDLPADCMHMTNAEIIKRLTTTGTEIWVYVAAMDDSVLVSKTVMLKRFRAAQNREATAKTAWGDDILFRVTKYGDTTIIEWL